MSTSAGPLPLAVFASGRGSNLEALIAAQEGAAAPIRIVFVGSDKAAAPALERAARRGIPHLALDPRAADSRAAFDRALLAEAARAGAQLIVLAGFMRILDGAAIAPWAGRIINIHPSLLPKYPGLHTHRRALEAGDREHGASVHVVTAELDAGPVLAQARIPVRAGDTADSLAARLLPEEHRLLVAVVAALARGELRASGRDAAFRGRPLAQPLRLAATGFGLDSGPRAHAGR